MISWNDPHVVNRAMFRSTEPFELGFAIHNGGNPLTLNSEKQTLIHVAVQYNRFNLLKPLLHYKNNHQTKIDVNAIDEYGMTALSYACKKSVDSTHCYETIQLLLDHGASVRGFDSECFANLLSLWERHSLNLEVDLSFRGLGDNELEHLATVLLHHQVIKLNLKGNQFSHAGLSYLARTLENNKTVRHLNIDHNNISSRSYFYSGVQYLFKALSLNKTLESLNIEHCQLDKADINSLINFLKTKSKTLKEIHFQIPSSLLKELSEIDQALIRKTQYLTLINQWQTKIEKYQAENEIDRSIAAAVFDYLEKSKEIYDGKSEIVPFLDGIAQGLIEFYDIAYRKNLAELTLCLQNILDRALVDRTSFILKSMEAKVNVMSDPINTFHQVFQTRMNALYSAASGIYSSYLESKIVTPTEQYVHAAKNIIQSLLCVSHAIDGTYELIELASHIPKNIIIEGAKLIGNVDQAAIHPLIENPMLEHGLELIKNKLIRAIHGSTEQDKCERFIYCFKNAKNHVERTKFISHAIVHHFSAIIEKLTPVEAKKLAEYVCLHAADLCMSEEIFKLKDTLTAPRLAEEIILWLAYVPFRDTVRVKILSAEEKQLFSQYFIQPRIKIDENNKENEITISTNSPYGIITQNKNKPARFATEAELIALKEVISKFDGDSHLAIVSPSIINHLFIFHKEELTKINKGAILATHLSSYKTPSKRTKKNTQNIKKLKIENKELKAQLQEQGTQLQAQGERILALENMLKNNNSHNVIAGYRENNLFNQNNDGKQNKSITIDLNKEFKLNI